MSVAAQQLKLAIADLELEVANLKVAPGALLMYVHSETQGTVMAKKKKRGGEQNSRAELDAALEALGIIEKDVAKVRANLRKFLDQPLHILSRPWKNLGTSTARAKTPPR